MAYDLTSLNVIGGLPRHVWIGPSNSTGGFWEGIVSFDQRKGKPHDQVVLLLEALLSLTKDSELFPKIAVGKDAMWESYPCYETPRIKLS